MNLTRKRLAVTFLASVALAAFAAQAMAKPLHHRKVRATAPVAEAWGPNDRDSRYPQLVATQAAAKAQATSRRNAHKAKASAIVVIEDVTFDVPKTKNLMNILKAVKADDKKILFITPEYNDILYKSIRNVPSVLGALLSDVNTYDIMNSEMLVLTESSAKIFAADETEAVAV